LQRKVASSFWSTHHWQNNGSRLWRLSAKTHPPQSRAKPFVDLEQIVIVTIHGFYEAMNIDFIETMTCSE